MDWPVFVILFLALAVIFTQRCQIIRLRGLLHRSQQELEMLGPGGEGAAIWNR